MNSYIPKQPKHQRERVEAKLDARLVRRLEAYCQYLESDRDYVIAQALDIIFRKDRGFAEWLESHADKQIDHAAALKRPRRERPLPVLPEVTEPRIGLDPARRPA